MSDRRPDEGSLRAANEDEGHGGVHVAHLRTSFDHRIMQSAMLTMIPPSTGGTCDHGAE